MPAAPAAAALALAAPAPAAAAPASPAAPAPPVAIDGAGAPATPVTPGTEVPARNASSAAAIEDADDHRSAGSVASALRSMATRSAGIPDRNDDGSGAGPARRAIATAAALSASHGRWPVSSSNRTLPSE